jgi:hypothetical protein
MVKTGDVCIKKNNLGDCIEWQEVSGKLVPSFKHEHKECNKELYEKWRKATKEKGIAYVPEE